MVVLFLNFWKISILFSIVAAPIYIIHHQVVTRLLLFPHPYQNLLSLVLLITAILTGMRSLSHCDFVYISLMIINVVYLFMQLLVIWMSSLEKCLLRSFAHFLVALLAFCYWVEKKLRRYFDLEKTLNGNINVKRLRTASFSFLLKSTSAKYSFWWTNK